MALDDTLREIVRRLRGIERQMERMLEPTNSTCILRDDSSQTFADGVAAAVTFGAGTEIRDLDDLHNTGVNPERVTCLVPGVYVITGDVMWEGDAAGDRELILYQNGPIMLDWHTHVAVNTACGMNVVAHAHLAKDDYIWMEAMQTSGGNLDVLYKRLAATRIA